MKIGKIERDNGEGNEMDLMKKNKGKKDIEEIR